MSAAAEAKKLMARMYDGQEDRFRVVAPLVSRHIDFLQTLASSNRFHDEKFLVRLREALAPKGVVFFLGSAPVGPSTVHTMTHLLGKQPRVRFGSTETALQVTAIPFSMSEARVFKVLERGWTHVFSGEQKTGFYIGRPHASFTEIGVVRSVDPKDERYMRDCEEGEPGFLVSRGNSMLGYANATVYPFSQDGWYLGFGDIGFFLVNATDGLRDYYWISRAADILIKGGANYSCQQISNELLEFLCSSFGVPKEGTTIATIGIKWRSEHEDDTCVTIELPKGYEHSVPIVESEFLERASTCANLYKALRPDFMRVAAIPRTFKGAVDLGALRKSFIEYLENNEQECRLPKATGMSS